TRCVRRAHHKVLGSPDWSAESAVWISNPARGRGIRGVDYPELSLARGMVSRQTPPIRRQREPLVLIEIMGKRHPFSSLKKAPDLGPVRLRVNGVYDESGIVRQSRDCIDWFAQIGHDVRRPSATGTDGQKIPRNSGGCS